MDVCLYLILGILCTGKKTKLWGKLEAIVGHKETIFGVKCHIKLRGIAKEIWIQPTDLSKGVAELYKNKQDLSSNSKARVDRGHVIVQKKFLKTQKDILEKQKDHPSVEAASAAVTKTVSTSPRQTDPIRVGKKCLVGV